MPDVSLTESVPENSHKKRPPFLRWWKSPRSTAFTALAIALIAAAVAIAGWLRPAGALHSFSGQQSAQAKTNVCSAYTTAHKAVSAGIPDPHPGDPVAQLSVAANVRLVLLGSSAYLRDRLAAEPAAPADLAKAVNSMADTLEQMVMSYFAEGKNPVLGPLRRDLNDEIREINTMCSNDQG